MLSKILKKVLAATFLFYPILVFLSIKYFSVMVASLVLSTILIGRLILSRKELKNPLGQAIDLVSWVALLANLLNVFLKDETLLKLYPFFMSSGAAFVFVRSLIVGPPLIESIARRFEGDLNEHAIQYTRKLTILWSVWLTINTVLALYTAIGSPSHVWLIYNNVVFYIVSGTLGLGDIIYRKFILRVHAK